MPGVAVYAAASRRCLRGCMLRSSFPRCDPRHTSTVPHPPPGWYAPPPYPEAKRPAVAFVASRHSHITVGCPPIASITIRCHRGPPTAPCRFRGGQGAGAASFRRVGAGWREPKRGKNSPLDPFNCFLHILLRFSTSGKS